MLSVKLSVASQAKDSDINESTFVLFVTPPSLDQTSKMYSRDIIFLLDRSGSMSGDPFSEVGVAFVHHVHVVCSLTVSACTRIRMDVICVCVLYVCVYVSMHTYACEYVSGNPGCVRRPRELGPWRPLYHNCF